MLVSSRLVLVFGVVVDGFETTLRGRPRFRFVFTGVAFTDALLILGEGLDLGVSGNTLGRVVLERLSLLTGNAFAFAMERLSAGSGSNFLGKLGCILGFELLEVG